MPHINFLAYMFGFGICNVLLTVAVMIYVVRRRRAEQLRKADQAVERTRHQQAEQALREQEREARREDLELRRQDLEERRLARAAREAEDTLRTLTQARPPEQRRPPFPRPSGPLNRPHPRSPKPTDRPATARQIPPSAARPRPPAGDPPIGYEVTPWPH